jgi:hypothetical protein
MEDIKQYLDKKGALSAAFNIRGKRCYMYIAVRDDAEFEEIINNWDEIKQQDTDLYYLFSHIAYLPRQQQMAKIQQMIRERGATSLIQSEEQRVAKIAEESGATRVHYIKEDDKMRFLILGNIGEKAMEELREVHKEYSHIYMNPPRAKWKYTDGETEVLGPVLVEDFRGVKEEGEQIL